MGTSGAYGGSGGTDGRAIRDAILDAASGAGDGADKPSNQDQSDQQSDQGANDPDSAGQVRVNPEVASHAANLFSSSRAGSSSSGSGGARRARGGGSAGGSGGSRPRGGPQRSAARAASVAGRAAAGAIAYRTADRATLERLGLDFNELRQLGDPFEVIRRIVEMACGAPESTIEDDEQRMVAAGVAEWIVVADGDETTPSPEDVARYTVGVIIAEVLLSESGEILNGQGNLGISEQDIRDASEAAAARIEFSSAGATETELATAIEAGLETLRHIIGADS